MKIKAVSFRRVAVFGAVILALASCGGGGNATAPSASAGSTLTVVPPPSVATQPQAASAIAGDTASFNVVVSGQGSLTYQWQKNGVAIAGATTASYTTPALTLADSGAAYAVVISNAGGSVTSQSATLAVYAKQALLFPQPLDTEAFNGGSAVFHAQAAASSPVSYQWFRAGIAVTAATSDTLTVNPVSYADDGVAFTVQIRTADGAVSSQAGRIVVKPSSTIIPVTTCREINSPGSYRLTADIGPSQSPASCISIHDTSNVQLDCAGHTIADNSSPLLDPLYISNLQNFSIKNCSFGEFALTMRNMAVGAFTGNTISSTDPSQLSTFNISDSNHVVFDANTMAVQLRDLYSDSNTFEYNTISNPGKVTASGVIETIASAHARILNNTLDGGWIGPEYNGGTEPLGTIDGIVPQDVTDLVIENNLIQNVSNCGIEWTGTLASSTIHGNHIVKAGSCGMGSWYWNSMISNTVSQNIVEQTGTLFMFVRYYGLRPAGWDGEHKLPADTAIYFKDNVFDGNIFTNPVWPAQDKTESAFIPVYDYLEYVMGSTSNTAGELGATQSDFKMQNNVFKNNQFGSEGYAPIFGQVKVIPGIIVDGGGNTCPKANLFSANYPLKCN